MRWAAVLVLVAGAGAVLEFDAEAPPVLRVEDGAVDSVVVVVNRSGAAVRTVCEGGVLVDGAVGEDGAAVPALLVVDDGVGNVQGRHCVHVPDGLAPGETLRLVLHLGRVPPSGRILRRCFALAVDATADPEHTRCADAVDMTRAAGVLEVLGGHATLDSAILVVQNGGTGREVSSCSNPKEARPGQWVVGIGHDTVLCVGAQPLKANETRTIERSIALAESAAGQDVPVGVGRVGASGQIEWAIDAPLWLRIGRSTAVSALPMLEIEDFVNSVDDLDNRPKELSVQCPVDPFIVVAPLDREQYPGACFVLNVGSETFNATMGMPCE